MKIVQKQCSGKNCESKRIARIYEVHYNPHHQGAVKVSNRNVQNFLTSVKDHKKKKNYMKSYNDFLIYYNNNKHSTTKVAPFRAMMNVENRDLIKRFKSIILEKVKRRRYYISFF